MLEGDPRGCAALQRSFVINLTNFPCPYKSTADATHLIYEEFKYTESYGRSGRTLRSDGTDHMAPYRELFYRDDTPINIAPPIEAFAAEPFYQLLRYQLLARQVEVHKADAINSASVLYIYISEYRCLERVIVPAFRGIGRNVFEVWGKLVKSQERFLPVTVDSLLAPLLEEPSPELAGWTAYLRERYKILVP